MSDEMGTFRVDVKVENLLRPGQYRTVHSALIDTGAELSWFPAEVLEALGVARREIRRFRQATGSVVERWVGSVLLRLAGAQTSDDVVFGEPGDLTILGSRSLEGLNLTIDPVSKRLVDAGPAPAAVAA